MKNTGIGEMQRNRYVLKIRVNRHCLEGRAWCQSWLWIEPRPGTWKFLAFCSFCVIRWPKICLPLFAVGADFVFILFQNNGMLTVMLE